MKSLYHGFSLIEILISIAVAAVILPGVIALQSLSAFTSGQGENYTKAYALAQQEMETIYKNKNSDWVGIITNCPTTTGIFTKCVTVTDIDADEKKVEIVISWNERGATPTPSVTIESIIANI
jgi:prepilin-type N-terminal cleavage/methylation domain-containing protein